MASERQIAANRRNAAKSTGPRSAVGKHRVAQNAVRHGLFSVATRVSALEEIEVLARSLANDGADDITLAHARSAAKADIEMNRARRIKLALIEHLESLDRLNPPQPFAKSDNSLHHYSPLPQEGLTSMPKQEAECSLEAMRQVLPDLERLTNYEKRAASRRDRSIRQLAGLK